MQPLSLNLQTLLKVARALGNLQNEVVYVGGAVVGLYTHDPAALDLRPTGDVYLFLEISSLRELEQLREQLSDKGFSQSHEEAVVCRFRLQGIKIDVMSTQEIGWAPANPWFGPGLSTLKQINIEELVFQLLSLPYFLASKFSAFEGRSKDPRSSHDLEDIVYILENHVDLRTALQTKAPDLQAYLYNFLKRLIQDPPLKEALLGNLRPDRQMESFQRIRLAIEALPNAFR